MSHIEIKVLFFASAKEKTGCDSIQLQLPAHTQLYILKNQLWDLYPTLQTLQPYLRWALNHQFIDLDEQELFHGDEIALIPPISGG